MDAILDGQKLIRAYVSLFLLSCRLKINFLILSYLIEWKRGSSVVRHLPLVLEVPGSIPARGEKNFGVGTRFL